MIYCSLCGKDNHLCNCPKILPKEKKVIKPKEKKVKTIKTEVISKE